MTGISGAAKSPLSATAIRPDALRDINHGQVSGWVFLGAALLGFFAILAWPSLVQVLIWAAAATALAGAGVWIQFAFREAEPLPGRGAHDPSRR